MELKKLSQSSAGRLVPTSFHEPKVRKGLTEMVPIEGSAFVPNPLPPLDLARDLFVGKMHDAIEDALVPLLKLEGVVAGLPNPTVLLRALRKREVQQSSTIENTVASIDEISRFEAGLNSDREEVVEVQNNLRALEHALTSPLPMSNRLFRDAHRILMEGVRGDGETPGEFRTTQVYIGDRSRGFQNARFVPPPPGEYLTRSLADFERYLNPSATTPPKTSRFPWLIELAFAHYQFETIHPFRDGNGRLGRMLVNIAPVKSGKMRFPVVNISEYFVAHRQAYYDALLRVSTLSDWEGWARLFCRAVGTQAKADLVRAQRLASLRDLYFRKFADKRNSVLTRELIDLMFKQLYVRTSFVASHLKVTVPTAQKHLDRLSKNGIVKEVTGGPTNRVYGAIEIIACINAPIHDLD